MSASAQTLRHFDGINNNEEENSVKTEYQTVKAPMTQSTHFHDKLVKIRSDILGHYSKISTPFGDKPLCYVDWTASGRAVNKIESYLQSNVMTLYGNTHTSTSITGHQSTCFRHEARQIIAEAVNAKVTGRAADDVVIFTGNGSTDAINKLVLSLQLNIPIKVLFICFNPSVIVIIALFFIMWMYV